MAKTGRVKRATEAYDPSELARTKSGKAVSAAAFASFQQVDAEKAQAMKLLQDTEQSILDLEAKYLDCGKRGYGNAIVGYTTTPGVSAATAAQHKFSLSSMTTPRPQGGG